MTNFSLNIKISEKDLAALQKAGESIVLLKGKLGGSTAVVWAVIKLAQNSEISWSDENYIYASDADYKIGNTIILSATKSGLGMSKYTYSEGSFSDPVTDNSLQSGQFMITNKVPASTSSSVVFGLAQSLSAAGDRQKPLAATTAVTVPAMQYTILNTTEKITIFLDSQVSAGQIIPTPRPESNTKATSFALTVDFSVSNTQQTVRYDSSRGSFVIAN